MFCIRSSEIEETWWNGEPEEDESCPVRRKSCRSLRDASEEVKK